MARYTIAGVIYNAAGELTTVDIVTNDYATYDAARKDLQSWPQYRFVCAAQEGGLIMRQEFAKGA